MKDWSRDIEEFRKVSQDPRFMDARTNAEQEAKDLLNSKQGRFGKDDLEKFLGLCNREIVPPNIHTNELNGYATLTRFQRSFSGPNKKHMIDCLDGFNELIPALWQSIDDNHIALDRFWSRSERLVKGAGIGLPTMIMYLKDPSNYNVWIPFLSEALENFMGGTFDASRNTAERSAVNYLNFNGTVNIHLRRSFGLKPWEIDYVLFRIGRSPHPEIA